MITQSAPRKGLVTLILPPLRGGSAARSGRERLFLPALRAGIIGITLLLTLASGCTGPTKTGQEARAQATNRMEFVHAQMAYDQARQSFGTGQLDKALKMADTAIARADEESPYHILRGRIQLEQHNLEDALRSFDRAIELETQSIETAPSADTPLPTGPNSTLAEGHYFRGIVFERWSNPTEASAAYLKAWELNSTEVQYLLAAAEMLITMQRFDEARMMVEAKLSYFEHNAALRQLLGQIALLQGDPTKAARLLGEARLLNPEDNMLLEELARAQFAAGQYVQSHYSVTQLQKLIGEERTDLMHLEARCLVMLDRVSDARNIYLRLSQLTPADAAVWIELGNVAFEVGDFRRVASCSTHIMALAPSRFEGYLLRGLFEQHSGNHPEAVRLFQRATELAPEIAWPHVLLGIALEASGQRDRAMLAYGAAIRAEPGNAEALRRLERMDGGAVAAQVSDTQ